MIALVFAVLLHPSHETTSELEWNVETGRLEVAMRLDALDEQWLQRRLAGKPAKADWVIDYLRSRFRIAESPRPNQPDPTIYHWVGREEDGSHIWWYFEIEPRDRQPPDWIDVRVLFEREKNYTHQVVRLGQTPRQSMTLSNQHPRRTFDVRDEKKGDGSILPSASREAATDR